MKKLTFPLIVAVILLTSCMGQQSKTNKDQDTIMKTVHLTKAEFSAKVADLNSKTWKYLGDKPAIIDFYASWCGPCKTLSPILDELAAEYGDKIVIYKINTEEEQELAASFGIRSIPTLLFVPLNQEPQMSQGAMPKAQLKELIDNVLLSK